MFLLAWLFILLTMRSFDFCCATRDETQGLAHARPCSCALREPHSQSQHRGVWDASVHLCTLLVHSFYSGVGEKNGIQSRECTLKLLIHLPVDGRSGYFRWTCYKYLCTSLCPGMCFWFSWVNTRCGMVRWYGRFMSKLLRNQTRIFTQVDFTLSRQCIKVSVAPRLWRHLE